MVVLQLPAGSLLACAVENAAYAGRCVGFHNDCGKLVREIVERGRNAEVWAARKAVLGIDREITRIDIILSSVNWNQMQLRI